MSKTPVRRATDPMLVLLCLVVVAVVYPTPVSAQPESLPVDLPDGPARDGFDITRFSNAGNGWFETFHVEDTEPLGVALESGRVGNETRVLVIETEDGPLAFLQDQMAVSSPGRGAGRWQGLDGRVLSGV